MHKDRIKTIVFEHCVRQPLEPFVPQPLVAVHVRLGRLEITYYPPEWLGRILREKE